MNIPPQGIKPEDLDKIQIQDSDNETIARMGMLVTLYFEEPHDKKLRLAVGQCIEEYYNLVKSQLKWVGSEALGTYKLNNYTLPSMASLINPLDEYDPFELIMTGADKIQQASAYNLKTLLENKRSYKLIGYLSVTFPMEFLAQQPSGFFQRLVHDWCQRLSPYHGYAGLGLIRSAEYASAKAAGPLLFPLVRRFPGLEIDMPLSHSRLCVDGIKGVNWLTILSDTFLQKLGGQAALQSKLDEEFLFYDYPGGTMIQSGELPQIGDMEQNNIPEHYQKLYRLVKPVQAEYKDSIMRTPEDVDAREFAQQWLHRFE